MHMGRVNDVTHCHNQGEKVPSCILFRYRFTNEGLSTTIGTTGLPKLAR